MTARNYNTVECVTTTMGKPVCPVCRMPVRDGSHKRDHLQEYHPEAL